MCNPPNSPTGRTALALRALPRCIAFPRRASSIPADTIAARLTMMLKVLSKATRRCRANISLGEADPVAENSPDTGQRAASHCPVRRKPTAVQRPHTATRTSGAVVHRPFVTPTHSAGDCSSSTPTARRQRSHTTRWEYHTQFVFPMQALLVTKCRGHFLHSLLAVTFRPQGLRLVRYVEKHGEKEFDAGEVRLDMRF